MFIEASVGVWRKGQHLLMKANHASYFRPFGGFLLKANQKMRKSSATQCNVVGYTLMKGKKIE